MGKSKKLTKYDLIQLGLDIQFNENGEFYISNFSMDKNKKTYSAKIIHPVLVCQKRKYTRDLLYKVVSWGHNGRRYSYPLHRVIYAFYYGEIPEGYVVVSKSGELTNCNPNNLMIVRSELHRKNIILY